MDRAEEVKGLDRDGLKAYIKENKLDFQVLKKMSDDEIRTGIISAGVKSADSVTKDDSGNVTFYSPSLGLNYAHLVFRNGIFTTNKEEEIELLRNSPKFGVSIFER